MPITTRKGCDVIGGLKKVGGLLKDVAPKIAEGLLGTSPLGAIATAAAKKGLRKALMIPDGAMPDEKELLARVQNMAPDELAILVKEEEKLAEVQLKREEAADRDTQNARLANIKSGQIGWGAPVTWYGFIGVAGFVATGLYLIQALTGMEVEIPNAAYILVGAIFTKVADMASLVFHYHMGSSAKEHSSILNSYFAGRNQ